jgi:cell division protein FtsB
MKLQLQWQSRAKLRAEGDKLRAEGAKLRAEGDKLRAEGAKLRAEGEKLRAEGAKLRAEGAKLRAEGDKLWAEAIIEVYGNIKLEWMWHSDKDDYACELENGDVYEPIKEGE